MGYLKQVIGNHAEVAHRSLGEANIHPTTEDQSRSIHRILSNQTGGGAVLIGPTGSGRLATFEEGFSRLAVQPQLIRLNGSGFARNIAYGAVAFLLSKLDLDGEASRHELIHGLAHLLCPQGEPAVVLLGRPELIDEHSASLLAQLVTMKKIVLFWAHCGRVMRKWSRF